MHYRLYMLSPVTGGIVSGHDIVASTDGEAIIQAQHQLAVTGSHFELWCRTRRVLVQKGQPARLG